MTHIQIHKIFTKHQHNIEVTRYILNYTYILPRAWNLSQIITKNRPGGWNLTLGGSSIGFLSKLVVGSLILRDTWWVPKARRLGWWQAQSEAMGIGDAQRTQIHHPWSTSHDIIYEDTFPNLPSHARKKPHTKVVYVYYMENPGTCQLSKGRFPCWKSSSSGFQLFQWYSPPPSSKNPKIARSIAGAMLVPQGLRYFSSAPAEAQKHFNEEISEGYIWDIIR